MECLGGRVLFGLLWDSETKKVILRRGVGGEQSPTHTHTHKTHRREHRETKSVSKKPSLLSLLFAFLSTILHCFSFSLIIFKSLVCFFPSSHGKSHVAKLCKFVLQWLFFAKGRSQVLTFGRKTLISAELSTR